jgi:hypothetical protein
MTRVERPSCEKHFGNTEWFLAKTPSSPRVRSRILNIQIPLLLGGLRALSRDISENPEWINGNFT